LQELTVRAARELATLLTDRGTVTDPRHVYEMTLDELARAVDDGTVPGDLAARASRPAGPPLPEAFRLTSAGAVVASSQRAAAADGVGAGGGRGAGVVRHRVVGAPAGEPAVLVVGALEPALASALPGLAGLVSETGSTLSHLAIVARELGVPTVVAVPDARQRFRPGTRVLVDGSTGEVCALDELDESEGSS
jgi:pyruvate,water dikinase